MSYPPQYLAAQVITKEWVQPIDARTSYIKRPATSPTTVEMSWSPPMQSNGPTASGPSCW